MEQFEGLNRLYSMAPSPNDNQMEFPLGSTSENPPLLPAPKPEANDIIGATDAGEAAELTRIASKPPKSPSTPLFLDFFAGSGLVTEGMRGFFQAAWANDICEKKAAVYIANHGPAHFERASIANVPGKSLPKATLAWASFPCQDLSLAGKMSGITAARSGLVWQWLRAIDEMKDKPPILVAENVVGLVSAQGGAHYRLLHDALLKRGYKSGALLLDAVHWVPQSRPRIFVVSVPKGADCSGFADRGPNWAHSASIVRAAHGAANWVWWKLPKPSGRAARLQDVIEAGRIPGDLRHSERNLGLVPPRHMDRLTHAFSKGLRVVPGYRRTRNGRQVLELRFDEVAGCLRTPNGGSSRQFIVLKQGEGFATRLLTVRETARLMGAPDGYKIPGSFNDGYKAMGDAVAVPVVRHLARHLLRPLAERLDG